ncbi:hypothetical protein B7P34_20495 [Streptosporangium nondiastaticum]|uniref:Iminophenyl-pyruvate dimer synthase domain-containing protein n=1 Tax=Streptosporangium nondiastaticum TaxID=35764 RepID=A0A9X7PGE6_9ACTN|nr:ferritin-like domain-containing protein [Streptosporangium nondiastaticum]PSJ26903.1 hypothetical protein B7P34_20495 [Streptosporangium nondiastaticum]
MRTAPPPDAPAGVTAAPARFDEPPFRVPRDRADLHAFLPAALLVTGYPALLPYSRDKVPAALRHFGTEALDTFLHIERPEYVAKPPGHPSVAGDTGWTSIGQFCNTSRAGLVRLTAELGEAALFSGDRRRQAGPEDFYNSGGEVFPVTGLASAVSGEDAYAIDPAARAADYPPGSAVRRARGLHASATYEITEELLARARRSLR